MRDDELDHLIDAGLSAYGEPRLGIEGRVLAAVAADGNAAAQRPRWRVWAIGLGAAVCLLVALLFELRPPISPRTQPSQLARAAAPAVPRNAGPLRGPAQSSDVRVATNALRHPRHPARSHPLPKRDIFPTPRPLSPEMQALITYLARAPEKDRKEFLEFQAQQNEPVRIPPLQITPVDASATE